jgi:hypothetical protein
VIRVEATVEVDVGFEDTSLNFGNIRRRGQATKDAYVSLRGFRDVGIDSISTTSSYIQAEEVPCTDSIKCHNKLKVAVTVGPDIDDDLLNGHVTVYLSNYRRPNSRLYIYGLVVDDIEVTPQKLTFIVTDGEFADQHLRRTINVTNYHTDLPLEIVDVTDAQGFFECRIDPGRTKNERLVTVMGTDKMMTVDKDMRSEIIISTNNPDQRLVKIPFEVKRK